MALTSCPDANRTFKLASNDLDLVPPLLGNVDEYDLNELGEVDFSYRAICCHVLIETALGRDIMLFIDQREHQPFVALEVGKQSGRLEVSGELSKLLIEEARARSAQPVRDSALPNSSFEPLRCTPERLGLARNVLMREELWSH